MLRITTSLSAVSLVVVSHAVFGINTGPNDIDTTFVHVGRVIGQTGMGSGVPIAPHWVLTARHVPGTTFRLGNTNYTAVRRFNDPNSDLALLEFSTPLPGYYHLFTGNPMGREVTMVGFGGTGTHRGDNLGYNFVDGNNQRRAATNRVEDIDHISLNFDGAPVRFRALLVDLDTHRTGTPSPFNRDWFGGGGPTLNEGGVDSGDSGGAWFIQEAGHWRLAGITSVKFAAPDIPWGTTGDHFKLFGHSGSGAVDPNYAAHRNWVVSTVPEPGTMTALAVGLGALIMRRRRKR